MKKIKLFLSLLVMFFISGGAAFAVIKNINSETGEGQTLQDGTNIDVVTSVGGDLHTFNLTGTIVVSNGGTGASSFTSGSVLFSNGTVITEDNTFLSWNDTTNKLTVNEVITNTITATSDINLTPSGTNTVNIGGDSIVVKNSTTNLANEAGKIFYDTDDVKFKGFTTAWENFAMEQNVFQVDTGDTLTTSLVAYWKLDELTGTRKDFFSTHDMTLGEEPDAIDGQVTSAADFTESNSEYLSAGDDPDFDATGNVSISFWIKTTSTEVGDVILSKYDNVANGKYWILTLGIGGVAGKVAFDFYDGTNQQSRKTTTSINDGSWHHIVATWDDSANLVNLYVDNGSEESVVVTDNGTVGDISNDEEVFMGRHETGGADYITAALDEMGFWDKLLSAQERADLWNSGNGQTMIAQ